MTFNNQYKGNVIWSQVDANQHLRHSAYADFGAQARIDLLDQAGLRFEVFQERQLGPILFREELQYLREVSMNDTITVTTILTRAKDGGSRWSIRHEIFRSDGVKAAIINVDGAWMSIAKRRLARLPEEVSQLFMQLPKSEDYVLED